MRECDENEGLQYLTLTPDVTLRKEKEINYTPIGMHCMRKWVARFAEQKVHNPGHDANAFVQKADSQA